MKRTLTIGKRKYVNPPMWVWVPMVLVFMTLFVCIPVLIIMVMTWLFALILPGPLWFAGLLAVLTFCALFVRIKLTPR